MKVQGISVIRAQDSGKVDYAATVARFVKAKEEKFQEELSDFKKALDFKLAGGKDHEDAIAEELVAFWSKYAVAQNVVSVQRSIIVGLVTPKLIEKGHFKPSEFKDASEKVEQFIYDNSCTKDNPNPDAWFLITTGRGRKAGMVTEQRRPKLHENLEVVKTESPTELQTEVLPTVEESVAVNELAVQLEAAAEALSV